MHLYNSNTYLSEIKKAADTDLPWDKLKGQRILITGATGLIGKFLIDVLLYRNRIDRLFMHIIAVGRDREKLAERFGENGIAGDSEPELSFLCMDITKEKIPEAVKPDYILHFASTTHPAAYASEPVATIMLNIQASDMLLELARNSGSKRFLYASSVEVYGENTGGLDLFGEQDLGYIDCNTLRAGYPESKRTGEALCQAYKKQYGVNSVIVRFARTYGPTMLMSDTKAIAQFIQKAVSDEDIILKSDGHQLYSYAYVADAVTGCLSVLLKGASGEAYNLCSYNSDIQLRNLAYEAAFYGNGNVVFDNPDAQEREGYSKATKAVLDASKLQSLGWTSQTDLKSGIKITIEILKALKDRPLER